MPGLIQTFFSRFFFVDEFSRFPFQDLIDCIFLQKLVHAFMINFVFLIVAGLVILNGFLSKRSNYDVKTGEVSDELSTNGLGFGLEFEVQDFAC